MTQICVTGPQSVKLSVHHVAGKLKNDPFDAVCGSAVYNAKSQICVTGPQCVNNQLVHQYFFYL
jgi:hypothetical protein